MGRVLQREAQLLQLLQWHEALTPTSFFAFHDIPSAVDFLRSCATDPLSMMTLRDCLAEMLLFTEISHLDDQDVLEQLAWRLVSGQLLVVPEAPRSPAAHAGRPLQTAPESTTSERSTPAAVETANYVALRYRYCDGEGVAGAAYDVIDVRTEQRVASGVLDAQGEVHIDLPLETEIIQYTFHADPLFVTYRQQPVAHPAQASVQPGWRERVTAGIRRAGTWVWGTVQGDFNEEPSVGQLVTNTVITMLPVVDQLGDVRDIVANLKLLIVDKRSRDTGVWVGFVLTMFGCIPELGSLLKGIGKILARGLRTGRRAPVQEVIAVFNRFAKGHAITWLRELSANLPQYGHTARESIKALLANLRTPLERLSQSLPGQAGEQARAMQEAVEEALQAVDTQVDQVVSDLKHELDVILEESTDFSQQGPTRRLHERQQVQQEPPELPASVPKGLDVPKNLPKNIHTGQQGKHIPGHNNFTPGRSPLVEGVDAQKLLDGVHSGAHPIVRMTPRGQPVVDFGQTIGQFEGKATQFGVIHHGKDGAHIVPANPVQF